MATPAPDPWGETSVKAKKTTKHRRSPARAKTSAAAHAKRATPSCSAPLAEKPIAGLVTVAIDKLTARLAVQLGRQEESRACTVDEIVADAVELTRCGRLARRAVARGKAPDAHVRAAVKVTDRYGADLHDLRDLNGTVMAIKFWSGLYSSAYHNLFFIA